MGWDGVVESYRVWAVYDGGFKWGVYAPYVDVGSYDESATLSAYEAYVYVQTNNWAKWRY
jgi:hypothetical protein